MLRIQRSHLELFCAFMQDQRSVKLTPKSSGGHTELLCRVMAPGGRFVWMREDSPQSSTVEFCCSDGKYIEDVSNDWDMVLLANSQPKEEKHAPDSTDVQAPADG